MKYIITAFVLGIIFAVLVSALIETSIEKPFSFFSENITEPSDSVDESQIKIEDNKIVIEIKDASLSKYAATGSMLPVLNENSNGIRVKIESEDEIEIGDIITFKTAEGLIVHRVIEISEDSEGWYVITKGDNASITDGKIRFEQIRYKTIGVLW